MRRFLKFILVVLWLSLSLGLQASQRFFNLTYEQVKIDSVLPRFAYSIPLHGDYRDSVYRVSIVYPEFVDMSQRNIEHYNRLSGAALPAMPPVQQFIAMNRRRPELVVSFLPFVYRDGRYRILASFMLKVESFAVAKAKAYSHLPATRSNPSDRYVKQSVLANGRWVKIRVPSSGVYQLTETLVRKAGFRDINKVHVYGYGGNLQHEVLTEADLVKGDDLHEVAQCVVDGRHLFYARGPVSWESKYSVRRIRNPYSDYGYYFLTETEVTSSPVDTTSFLKTFYASADDYHSLYERDGFAWYQGGRNLFDPEPIAVGQSKSIQLRKPRATDSGRICVAVSAGSNSEVEVYMGDRQLGRLPIRLLEYDKGNERRAVYPFVSTDELKPLEIKVVSGGPVRLDYVSITWDGAVPAPIFKSNDFAVPELVGVVGNQNRHADAQADMVIIVPSSGKLTAQAMRLKEFHEKKDGLRVNIVPADELYNEFSSGTPDANAYRRYLKMLYDRAASADDAPRYLLLFGDGVWDNRMLTNETKGLNPDDYLLCYESENSFNQVECYVDDNFFGLLDDGEGGDLQARDLPDVAVGRFPVSTADEAKIMVDKTISYATNANAGAWQNTLVFMGDDGNNNLHMDDANTAADEMASQHQGYVVRKIMWDAYKRETSATGNSFPDVRKAILQQQARGALVMDYAGHGSEIQISHEGVLRINDFASFTNSNLPLWITASCDIMPFDGTAATIGETALLNPRGGAVAFFGTARTVYAIYNKPMNMSYLKYVLGTTNGQATTIGEASRLAQVEMITTGQDLTSNKLQYALLGDPALRLHQPKPQAVVDSINGIAVGTTPLPVIKAGGTVRIAGHINSDRPFNGVATMTVRDSRELVTCRLNDNTEAENAFQYYDRPTTIFTGSDSVKAGKFSFSFAVPRDINYSNGNGLINVYAVNDDHDHIVHGSCDRFLVGGSAELTNDSIGPSIYCYLNSPSFENGGRVNSTPYFVARLTDKDGINVSGSGIGHNLELIIDGDMNKTYVLNDNFQYEFGSYTSGSTYYNIPPLAPGKHRLQFKAWDILNNSSTTWLDFEVAKGLRPNLFSVDVSQNPARTGTRFIINHDRVGSKMDVELEVFDTSGRLLWRHKEQGVPTSNAYTVDWNLRTDGGSQLQTGIYLYRAKIACEGSEQASKAQKLIVVGNK